MAAGDKAIRRALRVLLAFALASATVAYVTAMDVQSAAAVGGGDTITTFAGTTQGFSGDGGPAIAAQLDNPSGVAVDGAGNLYIADSLDNRGLVRKVDPAGVITAFAGTTAGLSGDGGPATAAQLGGPTGVAVDNAGNVYIADAPNDRVRKVDTSGIITTFAGTTQGFSGDGGPATAAQLSNPVRVAVDDAGNVYIADNENSRVRKVDTSGIITTIAGSGPSGLGTGGFSGDGGPATSARLNSLFGIAVESAGNVYIADSSNHRIRKIDTSGIITTIAGSGPSWPDPGAFSGDGGPATSARLALPIGVALDDAGNVYTGDSSNHRVRMVDTSGVITTIAGTTRGFSGDGGPAAAAQLDLPVDVALDSADNLYIADRFNHRIRRVGPSEGPPKGPLVLFVQGINSEWGCTNRNDGVLNVLGEVAQVLPGAEFRVFSYAGYSDCPTDTPLGAALLQSEPDYDPIATCRSIDEPGGSAESFKTWYAAETFGRSDVYVLAHSMGGVVVSYALASWDEADAVPSNLRSIVTLDSPLQGRVDIQFFRHCGLSPAPALDDLQHSRPVIQAILALDGPLQYITSIGNNEDLVVPPSNSHLPGAWLNFRIDYPCGGSFSVGKDHHCVFSFPRAHQAVRASVATPFEGGSRNPPPLELCEGRPANVIGSLGNDKLSLLQGDDRLFGSDGPDVIVGMTGKDTILGLGADDWLCGGDGKDNLFGGDGSDHLFGAADNDDLFGNDGTDYLFGGDGKDKLWGDDVFVILHFGDDVLDGGPGKDKLYGGFGADTLLGGSGDDKIWGTYPGGSDPHVDTLDGQPGRDVCVGSLTLDLFTNCRKEKQE